MSTPARTGRPGAISTIGLTGAPSAAARARPKLPAPPPPDPAPANPASAATAAERVSYTIRMDSEESNKIDRFTLELRPDVGRRVDRSEIIRALLMLVASDSSLRNLLVELLKDRKYQ